MPQTIPDNTSCTIHWVNSAKSIGVILIVLGHLLHDCSLSFPNHFIYSFHVPLFFILSGYVQKKRLKENYLTNKVKRLIIPFLIYAIIEFVIKIIMNLHSDTDWFQLIINSFYIKGEISNSPLWFLVVMFEICIVVYISRLPEKSLYWQIGSVMFSFILGLFVYKYSGILWFLNCFGINRMIVCFGFYALGLVLKNVALPKNRIMLPLVIVSFVLNIIMGVVYNTRINIYAFKLGSFILFYSAAIFGSLAVIGLCKCLLDKDVAFASLSRYTILFLGTQYYISKAFQVIMKRMMLSKTVVYDTVSITIALAILVFIPIIYNCIVKKTKIIKLLNGEVL